MDIQVVETVLTEILEELKSLHKVLEEVTARSNALEQKVNGFSEKQEKLPIIAPPIDTRPIEKIASRYFMEFCRIIEAQPKKVVRNFRLLLFPETNTGYYYKIIFGRLIPWGGLFVVAAFLISLGSRWVDDWSRIREKRYNYEVYGETLNRLDSVLTKSDRQKLRVILEQVEKEHD